jgi:hypothetical protein
MDMTCEGVEILFWCMVMGWRKTQTYIPINKVGSFRMNANYMNQRMTLGNVTQSQFPLYIYFATIDGLSNKTIIIHQFQVMFSHLYLSPPINNFFLDVCTNSIQNEYFFYNDMDYWKKSCF